MLLALAERGLKVQLLERDDEGDPVRTAAIAERLAADGVRYLTGLTASESVRAASGRNLLVVASGAVPGMCPPRFFSAAPPEDAVHENAGAIAKARRYRSLHVVASVPTEAALRRRFDGRISFASADAQARLREIRSLRPDAVYIAAPPDDTLAFLRAYQAEGLFHRIPVIAASVEPPLLEALGPDFAGLIVSTHWAPSRSPEFTAAFRARFARTPSSYAMQGYEAAGILEAAMGPGPQPSPFPVGDWRAWEVFNESSGAPYLAARERTLQNYVTPHAAQCAPR